MNWITFFTMNCIPYQVYKLNQDDEMILLNKKIQDENIFIILSGAVILIRIFYNKEAIPVAILSNNNIIENQKINTAYYKIIALKTTYIITLNKRFLYREYTKKISLLRYYRITIEKYEETILILNQKNLEKRIIMLILSIFLSFGKINEYKIILSFNITQQIVSLMTSTSMNTVNKIMNKITYVNKRSNYSKHINNITIKNLKLM
uniref:Global nitrogen transcriptional regulator n=1 Tax=Tolypiocladia glomerulata TaxID=860646 RepID=A0A1Z1MV90_9FLOR|nr:global nitrogen transcriptional regulator [Tolypiocladia glomerulata]ARW69829.1 global nitrogen transcriptional regulator [Tolypiocladia glomerulata]